eukprot:gene10109-2529_t
MDENTESFWQRNINKLTVTIIKSLLDENGVEYQKNEKKPKLLGQLISVILTKKLLNCSENTLREMKLNEEMKRKFLIFPEKKETSAVEEKIKNSEVITLDNEEKSDEDIEVVTSTNEYITTEESKEPNEETIKTTFLTQVFEETEEQKEEKITTEIKQTEWISIDNIKKIGFVKSIISDKVVIVQSEKESIPLKETSKFYNQEGIFIGQISLVFGPREIPLYKIENPIIKLSPNEEIFYDIQNHKKFEEEELYSSESEVDLSDVDNDSNDEYNDDQSVIDSSSESESESESERSDDDKEEMEVNSKKRKMSFDDESENKKIMTQSNLEEDALLAELFETPTVYENNTEE